MRRSALLGSTRRSILACATQRKIRLSCALKKLGRLRKASLSRISLISVALALRLREATPVVLLAPAVQRVAGDARSESPGIASPSPTSVIGGTIQRGLFHGTNFFALFMSHG